MELINFKDFKAARLPKKIAKMGSNKANRFFDSFSQVLNII